MKSIAVCIAVYWLGLLGFLWFSPIGPPKERAAAAGKKAARALPPRAAGDVTATAVLRSEPLSTSADNQPALQTFLDSLTAGSTATIPAGSWPVSSTLNIPPRVEVVGEGMAATEIKSLGEIHGPVVGWGGGGRWANSATRPRADGVTLRDLTVTQTANADTLDKAVWGENGDDATIRFVKVKGSSYEGIVSGNWNTNILCEDCEGENCGNGGPAYTQSTAAVNITSQRSFVRRFHSVGCGQGAEAGSSSFVIENCTFEDPGPGRPSIGVNIGSTGAGVFDVSVRGCRLVGYGMGCGNGLGRLAKVSIENNLLVDGGIGFMGGKPTNNTPHPGEGPDTFGSVIRGNTIWFTKPLNQEAVIYNTGPAAGGDVFGREPLIVEGNTVVFAPPAAVARSTPLFAVAGKVTAAVSVKGNSILGLDAAPGRGDFAWFSNNANTAVQNPTNLSIGGFRTLNTSALNRPTVLKIEGAP